MKNQHHVHYTFETKEGKKVTKHKGEQQVGSLHTAEQVKESKEVQQALIDTIFREEGIVARNLVVVKVEGV